MILSSSKYRFARGALLALSLLFACKEDEQQTDQLTGIGLQLSNQLLQSPAYMMYDTDFLKSVHYAEVCAAYGAFGFARVTEDDSLLDRIIERYLPLETDSTAWQDHHVDGNVYGILPFQFFQVTGDSTFLRHGLFLADSQWKSLGVDGLTDQARYWVDDVFMVSALQIEAFRSTGDSVYLDRAALFTRSYIDSLQIPETGLFHHGPNAPVYWGRGNGWMAAGMAMTLSKLPEDHKLYRPIRDGYRKMMEALIRYQAPSGMWRQVLDLPDAWSESSCTAMFAYAMSVGVGRGILSAEKYQPVIEMALSALTDRVNSKNELTGVCAGTGQSRDVNYYLERPQIDGDFHGQAPLLWLITSELTVRSRY